MLLTNLSVGFAVSRTVAPDPITTSRLPCSYTIGAQLMIQIEASKVE
jgi:hypothetical protein